MLFALQWLTKLHTYFYQCSLPGPQSNLAPRSPRHPRPAKRASPDPGPVSAHISLPERVGSAERAAGVGTADHVGGARESAFGAVATYRYVVFV